MKVKDVFNEKFDGKEYNTAKRVSIATEFDKFKDVLFTEKIIRHKMKRCKKIVKRLKKVVIKKDCNKENRNN